MFLVKVKEKDYQIAMEDRQFTEGTVNGNSFNWDVLKIKEDSFHILKDNKSYNAEILQVDYKEKTFVIKVNGRKYSLDLKDRFDILLEKMGMADITSTRISNIKAPMPGLVLDIIATEGVVVKKGDPVLVLEAMKMENVLKSPSDGKIKNVRVKKSMPVEKNEILIEFE